MSLLLRLLSYDEITQSKSYGDPSDRKNGFDTDAWFSLSRSQVRNGYDIRVISYFPIAIYVAHG